MKSSVIGLSLLLVLWHVQVAHSDFGGPSVARHALSPDGKLLVRIKTANRDRESKDLPKHEVTYYEFDGSGDSYVRRSNFELEGYLSQMLYISNSGQLIFVSLGEKHAIRLYSNKGVLTKSWSLKDFLTEAEIEACAETGSTLQWLEEGTFYNDVFYVRGPSRLIRALSPPFTVMRGADNKITFSASIDTTTGELQKGEPDEP